MEGKLNLVANSTTTKIRSYLSALAKEQLTPNIIMYSLEKIAKELPHEKYLIHTQLFLHIEIDEVKSLRDNSEFSPLAPTNYVGFSPELYVRLVFALDLHSDFIELVVATIGMQLSMNLLILAVPQIGSDFQSGEISVETIELYLVALGKLARESCTATATTFYTSLLQDLVKNFMKKYEPHNAEHNRTRLPTLFKLAGIVCMSGPDYTGENEIAELNQEWAYDPSKVRSLRSREVFQFVFNCRTSSNSDSVPIGQDVLQIIRATLEDHKILATAGAESTVDHSEEVGNSAYLTKLILQKYSNEIKSECGKYLLEVLTHFAQFKTKMAFEDWKSEITTFEEFCNLIAKHGGRKRYQDEWNKAFLKYPNVLEEDCGLKVIEDLVAPNADCTVAKTLVELATDQHKISQEADEDGTLPDRLINIILSLLRSENLKKHRDEWIQQVFIKGVHNLFAKDEFINELNLISTKVGTMELETDARDVSHYTEILYSLCFQNGVEAVKSIFLTSIRGQFFKTLHRIKVFLDLPYVSSLPWVTLSLSTAEETTDKSSVIDEVLFRILSSIHALDPICEYIAKGLPLLIDEGLMTLKGALNVIQSIVESPIKSEKYEKLAKLMYIHQQLVPLALSRNELGNTISFVGSMLLFTYVRPTPNSLIPVLAIREMCLKMKELIAQKNGNRENVLPVQPTLGDEFASNIPFSLMEVGFMYIRSDDDNRKRIKAFLKNPSCHWKDASPNTDMYGKLVQNLLNWIANTCASEWNALLSFLVEVILTRVEYQDISVYNVINDVLVGAKMEWECRTIFFLKFYANFLSTMQNSDEENFKEKTAEQILVYQTLVTVILGYHEIKPQKLTAVKLQNFGQILQQTLLILLDFTEWIVLNCEQYETVVKLPALRLVSMIEGKLGGRSAYVMPIHQSIVSRLTLGKQGIAETVLNKNSKKKVVEGAGISAPVLMSEKIFNEYMELSTSEETMTSGDRRDHCEKEDRDLYPFRARRRGGKKAGFKFS